METKLPQPYSSPEMKSGMVNSPDIKLSSRIENSRVETEEPIVNNEANVSTSNELSLVKTLPVPVMKIKRDVDEPRINAAENNNPSVARDAEHIEKEWVLRAKQIISRTKSDPYAQEREISLLQADYLKKRYGKEVKTVRE